MSAEPRPQVLLTLDEVDALNAKIGSAYAMADLLYSSYLGADGPNPESLQYVSGMVFEALSEVKELWGIGQARQEEAAKTEA